MRSPTATRWAALRKLQPTIKQALNCTNVHRAYAALHNIRFDF